MLSSTALILMSCAIFLANRPRFAEPYFGGLDRMYQTHKTIALLAFFMILIHWIIMPRGELRIGTPIGIAAALGFVVLVLLTIAPTMPLLGSFVRFSYSRWRWTHRFIGLFFILAIAHSYLVNTLIATTLVPLLYLRVISFAGAAAYLYKELLSGRFHKHLPYVVDAVHKLNGTTLEVTLSPQDRKLVFNAGQFLFVHFTGDRKLAEPHPFTVSSAPQENNLRLSIKASGDWTHYLNEHLKPGTPAKVDGGYGMFNYKTGRPRQIWIAGGIGITPFLSWIRNFAGQPGVDVDFFYTVRSEAEALFLDELNAAASAQESFRAHVLYSTQGGRLSAARVAELSQGGVIGKSIYLCGPLAMTAALSRQFRRLGVAAKDIHFEEFNFR
jgi:predicted ferric reductase